jgi:phosphoadenosine phosphosulfate reductase
MPPAVWLIRPLTWRRHMGRSQPAAAFQETPLVHITMVKKRLANGDPCEKCAQTEEMLRRRGLWDEIGEVIWAIEGEDDSPGFVVANQHGVEIAPFFVVRDEAGEETVFKSALQMIRKHFPDAPKTAEPAALQRGELPSVAERLASAEPSEILRFGLERWGERCAIAFSGADDVVLIDMATQLKLPFSVFTLDTGRLHGETHAYLDDVRRRYGVEIQVLFPDEQAVCELVRRKGMSSFLRDGHAECCGIRKVAPLRRALRRFDAWVTGQRRDQSPATRSDLAVLAEDTSYESAGDLLVKLNPLARWSREQVWEYIRANDVPYNPLHDRGFTSIGCEPCSRPTTASQHERDGRWWWESEGDRECGLHVSGDGI